MPGLMSSKVPKPEHRHRNKTLAAMILPARGRKGRIPKWPLATPATPAVTATWERLWRTPQAVAWERLAWTPLVARYALLLVEVERPDRPVPLLGEVRQLEDRLGLSPMALARLRWEIVDEDGSAQPEPGQVANLERYRRLAGG